MQFSAAALQRFVARVFAAAGCQSDEAERVGRYLVEANLVGHDSHGVIRMAAYVQWLVQGKVLANQSVTRIVDADTLAILDGNFGLGQSIGEQAVDLGVEKCRKHAVSVIGLRNSGHLGRIGDWPLRAAQAGLLSLHFVNTSGAGMLTAPFGGIDRRLSACPIAAGIPIDNGEPILVDVSMCTIAEGKIRVALNRGTPLPDGCIIDSEGQPTNDPQVFYASPPGAILPMGQHKGYALGILTEVMAGALTGGSCTNPAHANRLANSMLSIYLDPRQFVGAGPFSDEVRRFVDFVKSSRRAEPDREVLVPGEVESRCRQMRARDGIPIDPSTWRQILESAAQVGVSAAEAEGFFG